MSVLDNVLDTVRDKVDLSCEMTNIGGSERVLSVVAGGFILGVGVKNIFRSPFTAFSGIALGGALVYRGITGHCKIKDMLESEPEATIIEHRYFVK